MTAYLIDTNHLSPLVTRNHSLRHRLIAGLENDEVFAIPAPVLTEFLFGIQVLPRAVANMAEWQKYQNAFAYYDIQQQDAILAATLRVGLRRHGCQLQTVDSLIAAIALRYELTLLTTDKDFQVVPGLAQENWI